ncbi:MAG: hypothetical protein PHV43_01765 [Candidatus Colwellbacteria bacterium]|nr:hypothetical protein [Candidatus Colwellbacteria bacterium]
MRGIGVEKAPGEPGEDEWDPRNEEALTRRMKEDIRAKEIKECNPDNLESIIERRGRIGHELFPVSDETRGELEKVYEAVDPITGGRFELLVCNPKGERGTVIVNGDFTADVENRPTREFLAYLADLYPDYKVIFEAPPGYGTDSLKTFAKTEKKNARTKGAFSIIARPSLRALKSLKLEEDSKPLELGEDVVIVGASMGAHIAVEQALVAEEKDIAIKVKKVVILAGPMEKRGTIALTKAFTKDDKLAQEQIAESPYLQTIIPTQEEKNEKAKRGGIKGMKHMLGYARDLAHSELENGLVKLALERKGIDVDIILGSRDSVANSRTYMRAIERAQEGGGFIGGRTEIGWSHGTLADIPRRITSVVPSIGRGGEEKLKELTEI